MATLLYRGTPGTVPPSISRPLYSDESIKNLPLTITEVDTNFANLNRELELAKPINVENTIVRRDGSGNFEASSANFLGNSAVKLTSGTTLQRPETAIIGQIRFNTDLSNFEGYDGSDWKLVGGAGGGGSVNKFTTLFGNTSNKIYTINHNLNTDSICISIVDVTTNYYVYPLIEYLNVNSISITFTYNPTQINQYKITVVG
jgi:hypothetical protein